MKKLLLICLFLNVGLVSAKGEDSWHEVELDIPENKNPNTAQFVDPYAKGYKPAQVWDGTKWVTGKVVDKTVAPAVQKAGEKIQRGVDGKLKPWQDYNNKLEQHVNKHKKSVEENLLAAIWYYLTRRK